MKSSPPKTRTRLGWGGRAVLFILFTGVWLAAQKDLLLDRARQALDKGDTTQAIALLENYRRAHATDAEVCNLLGIAYGREGKNEQSLAMFKELARLAPNTPGAYNNLGTAYLRHQASAYADPPFRHALKISPQDVSALYILAALLTTRHKYPGTRPLLHHALRPEHSSTLSYE